MSEITELPVLILMPHNRCNCRCVMCDIWRIRETRQLSPADLQPHLESIRKLGVKWVVLSGGEPQLNPGLPEISAMLRREGIRVSLLTAGLLLESRCGDAELFDDIIVSLDGPPAVHDRIRGVPRAYERLRDGIQSVRRERPRLPISARTTVTKENLRHLRETVATARELSLDSISFLAADLTSTAFNRAQPWDDARQRSIAPSVEEIGALDDEMEAMIRDCAHEIASGFIRETSAKLRRIVNSYRVHLGLAEAEAPRCNAPWVSAVVEADGTVRPCFFHKPIGNVHEGALIDIINGPRAQEFRRQLSVGTDSTCRRCVCSLFVPVASEVAATG